MIVVKKVLKLQDHKHTAKKIEHVHTSYRGLALVMLIFGVALFFVQRTVSADSYVVSAKVAAPIPTIAAEITSPTQQSTTESANIVISGICPIITPAIIVELYNNNELIGSAGCSASGEFSGTFSLVVGTNNLIPKILTITNDPGPIGTAKTVYYKPPVITVPAVPSPSNSGNTQSGPNQIETVGNLLIKTETPFLVFKNNQSFVWKVTITGGVSPYTILVDWGDGTKNTYSASSSGQQSLEHIFAKNKNTLVRISVKDATGTEVYTTVAGVTFQQTITPIVSGASASAITSGLPLATMWLLYGVSVCMIIGFWLGTKSYHHNLPFAVTKKKKAHKK